MDLSHSKRSVEVWVDIAYFSIITVIVNGLITLSLGGYVDKNTTMYYFLLGTVFWEMVRINQYTVSVGTMWQVWSKNLTNIFVAPVHWFVYVCSYMVSGMLKSLVMFCVLIVIVRKVFGLDIFSIGLLPVLGHLLNVTIFAWWLGMFILGLIFRYGTRVQSLAWGLIFLFQPLTASFFPKSVLPSWLIPIADALPATYVFEAARAQLGGVQVGATQAFWIPLGLNMIYFVLSIFAFRAMFASSQQTGQFVKNEG